MNFDHAAFRQSSEWLRFVSDDLANRLLERAHVFSVDEHALVYDLDEELGGLYGLVNGVVGIRTDTPETETVCAHLMGPGTWLGEFSVLTGRASAVGVEAKTPCTLIVVPTGALFELGAAFPDLWHALAILSAFNANKAVRVARDAMIRDPRERLLAVLDRLAGEIGFDTHLPLTQEQLAAICNLSLRATSKHLNQLVRDGRVVCGYGSIILLSAPDPVHDT